MAFFFKPEEKHHHHPDSRPHSQQQQQPNILPTPENSIPTSVFASAPVTRPSLFPAPSFLAPNTLDFGALLRQRFAPPMPSFLPLAFCQRAFFGAAPSPAAMLNMCQQQQQQPASRFGIFGATHFGFSPSTTNVENLSPTSGTGTSPGTVSSRSVRFFDVILENSLKIPQNIWDKRIEFTIKTYFHFSGSRFDQFGPFQAKIDCNALHGD